MSQGVPQFVGESSPTRAVLRRSAPILVAYLALTVLLTASFAWSFELNVLAIAVATALVVAAWALVNVVRGRQWRSLPERIGPVEVVAFLLIPTLPPLIIGFQVTDAVVALVESALFLVVVYVATAYGLLASARWAFGRARAQFGSLGRLLTRALPLLMVFICFVFLQSDTWQVAAALDWKAVAIVLAFFFGLSVAFLVGRLVPEIKRLASADTPWSDTLDIARRSVAEPLCERLAGGQPERLPLTWREWVNMGVLIIFSQGIQIVLVTLAVQVALIVFGLLLVPVPIQEIWTGQPAFVLAAVSIGGLNVTITGGLLSVALILGAFSGLYFTISALSDAAYRAEFFSDADRELEYVFAVRAVYHAALRHEPAEGAALAPPRAAEVAAP